LVTLPMEASACSFAGAQLPSRARLVLCPV
jgi:hypothetical protein